MNRRLHAFVLAAVIGMPWHVAFGTDRYFSDVVAESPSKRYRVEAKSPDNSTKKGRHAFQASFVYTCWDTTTKLVLWTRKQAMGKPMPSGEGPSETLTLPEEASPVSIFVADSGWTVIRTGWDELIPVDPLGHDRCRLRLLEDAFTKEERRQFVHGTTAGPRWSGYSLWYFLDTGGQRYFVLRPWWGHRVVLNLVAGRLVPETSRIANACLAYERTHVLTELAKGVATRKAWEQEDCCTAVEPVITAAYLAGRLPVPEAVPFLKELQDSTYSGSSTSGGWAAGETFEGAVNPQTYSTLTMRQAIHLSLRRLGVTPKPFAATQFDVQYAVYEKCHPYVPKASSGPRHANADKVVKGMKAEQVLDLLGAPDFVGDATWEYDMDAVPPYSLTIPWDVRRVIRLEKRTPALWQAGLTRDAQLIH